MFAVDKIIFIGAVLLLVGITSSKFSTRFGVPVLVVFLAVGMLAGSEGVGRIGFDNYPLAHGLATVALALILFDGGLRTPARSFSEAWRPALSLATVGVLVTAAITGVVAAYALDLPLVEGLLLGAIVSSTDAAAIFSLLRSRGLHLRRRLSATLEVESGSNDPMAVFLTVALIALFTERVDSTLALVSLFALQMGVGGAVGYAAGRVGSWSVNRVNLDVAGLYPILVGGWGLLSYGAAAALGGSGFLAVYITGITIGNRPMVFKHGVWHFHDGLAWLAQISLFVMLGLLSFPSRLIDAAPVGLLVAGVLIFVARPIAVLVSVLPFRFAWGEITVLSWAGLKGAVPIVLAIYPLLLGLADSHVLFDIVFFVVLVSALAQGWSLPWLASRLGVKEPREAEAPVTLEIASLRQVNADIVEYVVTEDCRAANRLVKELALPEVVVVAMIARGDNIIPPRGSTCIMPGDRVSVVLRADMRPLVDRAFAIAGKPLDAVPVEVEFPLQGNTKIRRLKEFYDIAIDAPGELTLDELMRSRIGDEHVRLGSRLIVGGIALTVRAVRHDGRIDQVGLALLDE